jgi:hypothetical protein
MTGQHEGDNGDADRASSEGPQKAEWHAPTLEEVDYSATEATGAGGVYDFTVYSGSTGP